MKFANLHSSLKSHVKLHRNVLPQQISMCFLKCPQLQFHIANMYLHSTCLFQGYLQYKNSLLWLTTVLKPIIRVPFTCSNKQIPCFPLTERECCLYIWLERKAYLPFHFLLLFAWFAILCRSVSKKQFSAGSAAAGFLQCFPLPAFRQQWAHTRLA